MLVAMETRWSEMSPQKHQLGNYLLELWKHVHVLMYYTSNFQDLHSSTELLRLLVSVSIMQDCGIQEWDSYDRVFQRPRQTEDWGHHREPGERTTLTGINLVQNAVYYCAVCV